jgi:hypothetical protein
LVIGCGPPKGAGVGEGPLQRVQRQRSTLGFGAAGGSLRHVEGLPQVEHQPVQKGKLALTGVSNLGGRTARGADQRPSG